MNSELTLKFNRDISSLWGISHIALLFVFCFFDETKIPYWRAILFLTAQGLLISTLPKNYHRALECYLKSFSMENQIGVDKTKTADSIRQIRKVLGLSKFKEVCRVVYDGLAKDFQAYVHLEEFI